MFRNCNASAGFRPKQEKTFQTWRFLIGHLITSFFSGSPSCYMISGWPAKANVVIIHIILKWQANWLNKI